MKGNNMYKRFLNPVLGVLLLVVCALPLSGATTRTDNAVIMTADGDTLSLSVYGTKISGVKVTNPTAGKVYRLLDGTTAGSGGVIWRYDCGATSATVPMDAINHRVMGSGGVNFDTDDTTDSKALMLWIEP